MNAGSRVQAQSLNEDFARSLERDYAKAAKCLRDEVDRMFAYYAFPEPSLAPPAHDQHYRVKHRVKLRCGPIAY